MLLNFDDLLNAVFGAYFGIRDSITLPLQTSTVRSDEQGKAIRKLQAQSFEDVMQFINAFRSSVPVEAADDQRFSFRVFLIPTVGNHRASSDLAIDSVTVNADDAQELVSRLVAIKEKQIPVHNANLLKPSVVARKVADCLGKDKKFTTHLHVLAWKKYLVRPNGFSTLGCHERYCVPDPIHHDYVYTHAWVDFLVDKLSDQAEYESLTPFKPPTSRKSPETGCVFPGIPCIPTPFLAQMRCL